MSRGLGWVQWACLSAIKRHESERWPTTFTIAAYVYQVRPDKDGTISDAQHVATKRALESLQRAGKIIGFRDPGLARDEDDGCHVWMTEAGLARWLEKARADAAHGSGELAAEIMARAEAIASRAKAAGMSVTGPR